MTDHVVQRIVKPGTAETAELYWRHGHGRQSTRISPEVAPECLLDLDTYFNSFDEILWRRHTSLGALRCTLSLEGAGRVELWRCSRHAPPALLAETPFSSEHSVASLDVPDLPHLGAAGRLSLRILADADAAGPARLVAGCWTTPAAPDAIRLIPVICTFDRDPPLVRLLRRLARDDDAVHAIERLVIVNNGPPGLPGRIARAQIAPGLAAKLHIVEQPNMGGAGGFTRGLLEARDLGGTHTILMDDDVIIEPEAIFRTARLFERAGGDIMVGGHMLDLFRPTHIYEAGARLDEAKLATVALHLGAEVSHPGSLDRFLHDSPMHYNGWWFTGLPLALLDRVGYPMPCFIRSDDVEFGRRLHDAGVKLVASPGFAIWHEPFYAKLSSWHIYYDFRNVFVLAARHLPNPSRKIAFIAIKWVVAELLMFRYARAALLIRAAEDFLSGPSIYERNPTELHREITALRHAYPVETAPREFVAQMPAPPAGPRSRAAFLVQLASALVSEWFRPDNTGRSISIEPRDHLWFRVRRADKVAVREDWEPDYPAYRRSRATFRKLLKETWAMLLRLRKINVVIVAWRDAHAVFTSEADWRRRLDMEGSKQSFFEKKDQKTFAS